MPDPAADNDSGSVAPAGPRASPAREWAGQAATEEAAETTAPLLDAPGAGPRGRSPVWRRIGRRPPVFAGAALLMILLLAASLAPLLAPYNPIEQGLGPGLTPPGRVFPLGLDPLGRDVSSRIVYGSRTSLLVGMIAVSIAFTGGLVLGVLWIPMRCPGGITTQRGNSESSRSTASTSTRR